ncbi:MAG: hypothetical protein Q8N81_02130 [bacterium]|nr:hypothetical protein [bacterium]
MEQKYKNTAKVILQALGIVVLVGGVMVFPGMALVLDWLDKLGRDKYKTRRAYYSLRERGMIKLQRQDNKIRILLTEKGKKRLFSYQIQDLKIYRPPKWDGRWRLVMFDVPEAQRSSRDLIRFKLRQLGFLSVQKSVYIHPYSCDGLIETLRTHYHLRPGELYVFEARVLEGEEVLKKHFKIK